MVQGITGKEGSRATKEMLDYGAKVTCGVTPGKGGQEVEGKPVFNTVEEAVKFDSKLEATVCFVPPLFLYGAAKEALDAGIKLIVIISENVPVQDSAKLIEEAKEKGATILGPASVGIIKVGEMKLGSIGSEERMYTKGNVAIVSKSGGMCGETALLLSQNKIGQSICVGIGGDQILGTSFTDMFEILEKDKDTKVIVMYGEIGGQYEEEAAKMIKKMNTPVVAFISGQFAEKVGREVAMGHAGAILEKGSGSAAQKKKVLKNAGVYVANYHDEIVDIVKKLV